MKKNFMYLMTIMMVAMMSVGFASCSKDDDSDGGSASVTIDGSRLSVPYVYWYNSGNYMVIDCYSFNLDSKMPSNFSYIGIHYRINSSQTEIESAVIPSGEYFVQVIKDANTKTETISWEGSSSWNNYSNNSPLYITRDGDKITLSIEKVEVFDEEDESKSKIISFNYSGSIKPLPEDALEF